MVASPQNKVLPLLNAKLPKNLLHHHLRHPTTKTKCSTTFLLEQLKPFFSEEEEGEEGMEVDDLSTTQMQDIANKLIDEYGPGELGNVIGYLPESWKSVGNLSNFLILEQVVDPMASITSQNSNELPNTPVDTQAETQLVEEEEDENEDEDLLDQIEKSRIDMTKPLQPPEQVSDKTKAQRYATAEKERKILSTQVTEAEVSETPAFKKHLSNINKEIAGVWVYLYKFNSFPTIKFAK